MPGYAAVHRRQQRCSKVMHKEPIIPKRKYESSWNPPPHWNSVVYILKVCVLISIKITVIFLQRCSSALSPSCDSDPTTTVSQKPTVAKWASLTLPQKRAIGRDVNSCSWGLSSRGTDAKSRSGSSTQHGLIPQPGTHHSNNALPHAQVAHSELNVRLPRGLSTASP